MQLRRFGSCDMTHGIPMHHYHRPFLQGWLRRYFQTEHVPHGGEVFRNGPGPPRRWAARKKGKIPVNTGEFHTATGIAIITSWDYWPCVSTEVQSTIFKRLIKEHCSYGQLTPKINLIHIHGMLLVHYTGTNFRMEYSIVVAKMRINWTMTTQNSINQYTTSR